jgi:glycosyltransferase involved in cell wall biosynthesis
MQTQAAGNSAIETGARVAGAPDVGVVVIGRNEGERLRRCLKSVVGAARRVVYVDSGSTDGSREAALALGADVVELDQRVPFTPGRARNAGFSRLLRLEPTLAYVQFIDGDCELVTGWLAKGSAFLRGHAEFAVVAGRRRERDPNRSVYNMLCAAEWDTHPRGESNSCGGDSMMRTDVFARLGGYRDDLMAGEEPELCIRMRTTGWRIWLLADEMTVHDAAMIRFGQWWRRAMRSGYGAVQGARLYGAPPRYHCVRALVSAGFWGLGLPIGTLLLATVWSPWFLLLLAAYAVQVVRLARRSARRKRDSWFEALFLVLSRFPQLVGQVKCVLHLCLRRQGRLIDYKSVP